MATGNSSTGSTVGSATEDDPPIDNNDDSEGSLLKQTLMNVDECFLYKLPPLATSGGYRGMFHISNCFCFVFVKVMNNDLTTFPFPL